MTTGNHITVGDRLPEVELHDLEGRPCQLSTYTGRRLLLFMWASW